MQYILPPCKNQKIRKKKMWARRTKSTLRMSTLEEDKKEMTEGREEMVFSRLYNILLLLILKEKTRLILRKKDWKSKISTYILGKNEGLP